MSDFNIDVDFVKKELALALAPVKDLGADAAREVAEDAALAAASLAASLAQKIPARVEEDKKALAVCVLRVGTKYGRAAQATLERKLLTVGSAALKVAIAAALA